MGSFLSGFHFGHECQEDDFHVRVLNGPPGYDHVVKNKVNKGLVSRDIWMDEIRTCGRQQTVRIVGVKRVPIVPTTYCTYNADSVKEELSILVKEAEKEGWTVVQTWSKMDRKLFVMIDSNVNLTSCIVFQDEHFGFHRSVKMELKELDKFPCDEGFLKFLLDL